MVNWPTHFREVACDTPCQSRLKFTEMRHLSFFLGLFRCSSHGLLGSIFPFPLISVPCGFLSLLYSRCYLKYSSLLVTSISKSCHPILKYISLTQNIPDSFWILCLPITAVGQTTVISCHDQYRSLPTADLCLLSLYLSLLLH